jgi:uncharacterized membrane protein
MFSHLSRTWHQVVVSLWFIPSIMVLGAVALGAALTILDPVIDEWITSLLPRLFGISADGARAILTAVATAMLSVAGLVFSITMVTLSLAANQYTSRLLRTFTRDRGTQLVLGVFLGVFAYCVVVLRGVREPTEQQPGFVPSLAVLLGIVFALASIAFLVYFIQHISRMIQASEIIAKVAGDTVDVIRIELRRQEEDAAAATTAGDRREEADAAGDVSSRAQGAVRQVWRTRDPDRRFPPSGPGYIRSIERQRLRALAAERDLVVRVPTLVGAFVAPEDTAFEVWGDAGEDDDSLSARLSRTLTLASSGDVYEDPRFGVRQLVDIALKALSPGINDPTTAVTCLDYLAAVLAEARTLHAGDTVLRDEDGAPRVVLRRVGFAALVALAFGQIAPHAVGKSEVLLRELEALQRLAENDCGEECRAALREQVERVLEVSHEGTVLAADRLQLESRAQRVLELLGERGDQWAGEMAA